MQKWTWALTVAAFALVGADLVYADQTATPAAMHGWGGDPFGDATVTRADAQAKAAAMFDRLDLNHDGKLDKADRAVRIGQQFDKMDSNHDGVLSKDEFIAAHEQAMAWHEAHHGQPGGMEHDHDGAEPGPGGPGPMGPGPWGPGGMAMLDTNGDSAISRDEFIAGALKRFDEADTNHDGKLTKDERRAAFHPHLQAWRKDHADMPPPPPPGGE